MTAAAPLFDRLIYVQRLRNAGVDEQQAIAQADALDGAFRESVATKADLAQETAALKLDIAELKIEIQQIDSRIDVLEANVKAEFASVRGEIAMVRGEISAVRTDLAAAIQRQTVWLGGTMIALLAIGVTLAKTL
jgi:predicted negative regulator of RcsB-dependent stress response